ncbi:nitrous oxide-stimulated promoter family protein [Escherichia coli]|nr:nitrous oxide-stimulated promoter family protein [Escherichia coli]
MSGKRISREKLTIKKMIDLYQAKCPQASAEPEHYEALFVYAQKRLDKCVFGEEKPACKQCPVHCYQPAKREEMKQIMRWAGPRMLWRHPILTMIDLYQAKCPQASAEPEHYEALFVYAQKRLDKCVFGEEKPACKQCPVHCYQPAKREEMKQIMRWAGPRMLWRHPILTVRHLIDDKRPVPELPEKYRPKKPRE